ncbi:unnamed protein product [Trifolium pratense]|nr:unnamed protein product [Trifolium pratense]
MKGTEVFRTSQFIDSLVSLKGLNCLVLHNLISDELLYSIARKRLPLTKLDLRLCDYCTYAGIFRLLSKCQRIQHFNLQYANILNDQHVVQLSSYLGDLVSINLSNCRKLTKSALVALVINCSSLSEIKMESIGSHIVGHSDNLVDFGVYPQLKTLFLSYNSWLSDEIITKFASSFPNLQLLDLNSCNSISKGICEVLRKCGKIRYLNLAGCSRVTRIGINFVVPNLEVLNLSNTKVDDKTLNLISKNCSGLSQLLLTHCKGVTKKAVKRVLENRTQLKVVMDGGVQA